MSGCGCKNNQKTEPVNVKTSEAQSSQQNESVQKAVQQTIEKYYKQKTKG